MWVYLSLGFGIGLFTIGFGYWWYHLIHKLPPATPPVIYLYSTHYVTVPASEDFEASDEHPKGEITPFVDPFGITKLHKVWVEQQGTQSSFSAVFGGDLYFCGKENTDANVDDDIFRGRDNIPLVHAPMMLCVSRLHENGQRTKEVTFSIPVPFDEVANLNQIREDIIRHQVQ